MTLDEFIDKLGETPREWYWMGSKLRITLDGSIHCPITALTALTKGEVLPVCCTSKASELLGLSETNKDEIVHDADFSPDENWSRYHTRIRKRLVEACGLTE